jgi:hypothetical protein
MNLVEAAEKLAPARSSSLLGTTTVDDLLLREPHT